MTDTAFSLADVVTSWPAVSAMIREEIAEALEAEASSLLASANSTWRPLRKTCSGNVNPQIVDMFVHVQQSFREGQVHPIGMLTVSTREHDKVSCLAIGYPAEAQSIIVDIVCAASVHDFLIKISPASATPQTFWDSPQSLRGFLK